MDNTVGFTREEAALTSTFAILGVLASMGITEGRLVDRAMRQEDRFPGEVVDSLRGKWLTAEEVDGILDSLEDQKAIELCDCPECLEADMEDEE